MKINNKISKDLFEYILNTYHVDVTQSDVMNDLFLKLQNEIDDTILGIYFQGNDDAKKQGVYWKNQLAWETRMTGQVMLEKMQKLNPERILDVGCGDNEWKKYFGDKLLGIDPFNSKADMPIGIMDINEGFGTWDIVMCLGSINFGDEQTIKNQVERAVALCKQGGKLYFRCNPGITHDNKHAQWIDFFPWSEEKLQQFAKELNCTVDLTTVDQPDTNIVRWGNRLYSEWTKL